MQRRADTREIPPSLVDRLLSLDHGLTGLGEWLLVQLRVAKYWNERNRQFDSENSAVVRGETTDDLPERWEMTQTIELWDWQRECAQTWLERGNRGIVKVGTGAGKTIFAQHLIERVQSEVDPDLRVAIVVPTIVLMHQWVDSLLRYSNLPRHCIGCLGGGSRDNFGDSTRILVCVLNSAAKLLPRLVQTARVGEHLLLIVDECHRAAGKYMSRIFKTPRKFSLGLSATPESDDNDELAEETGSHSKDTQLSAVVIKELGPIIYELGVAEAVRAGILSKFEIRHYGLPLEPDEWLAYENLSRDIRKLTTTLRAAAARRRGTGAGSLFRFAQHAARNPDSPYSADAAEYLTNVRRRKRLLYRARARTNAVLDIVSQTLSRSPESKILVFHESINEVMRLYMTFLRAGYRVTVDHSKLPESIRAESISLFRSGAANILVSARTLIEGFDVPSADVGIIAASSTSRRQRIQTIGRLLRRPKDADSKRAVIHTLYIAGTVDELIYEKVDWHNIIGAEQNIYFHWTPPSAEIPVENRDSQEFVPVEQAAPPRQPKPTEAQVDWSRLKVGDPYPGKFEGIEYTCDQQGNVLDMHGRLIANPQGIPELIRNLCGDARRFKVTPIKRAILCWDRRTRCLRFLGFLEKEFNVSKAAPAKAGSHSQMEEPGQALEFRVKQFRGQRRIQDYAGRYALLPGQATDPDRGQDAQRVIDAITSLERQLGKIIHKFVIEGGEAYCIVDGQRYHLCHITKGCEFK